jgi:hypothetical protein
MTRYSTRPKADDDLVQGARWIGLDNPAAARKFWMWPLSVLTGCPHFLCLDHLPDLNIGGFERSGFL